jgi:hypothetical protein
MLPQREDEVGGNTEQAALAEQGLEIGRDEAHQ